VSVNAIPAAALSFSPEFVWGAATAAYQIEGAAAEDGRATSFWYKFCSRPGNVAHGDTGEVACDFYHRHRGDVALMRELGLTAFRFSIAWSRVVPEGRGRVNEAGLDFYDRLVDELLDAGIRPFPTLYHWDLPQRLEDLGGWPARETATAFAEYVAVVADRLGDRVTDWTTHNEPFCSSWLGYSVGRHAPGRTDPALGLAAAHHVLLSHGYAVQVLRKVCPQAQVGIVLDSWPVPPGDDPRDVHAAGVADAPRRLFFGPSSRRVPGRGVRALRRRPDLRARRRPARDLEPIDFPDQQLLALVVGADVSGSRSVASRTPRTGTVRPPAGIFEVLTRLRDYDVQSLYVTENGRVPDSRSHDGEVRDIGASVPRAVRRIGRARSEAACRSQLRFVWSLLDGFGGRTATPSGSGSCTSTTRRSSVPKSSYHWYRDLIAATRGVAVSAQPPRVSFRRRRWRLDLGERRRVERPRERRLGRAAGRCAGAVPRRPRRGTGEQHPLYGCCGLL
jgi:beta-glucosidase